MKNARLSIQKTARRIAMKIVVSALSLAFLLSGPAAFSQSPYKVIHEFNGPDGSAPIGNMVFDASGNLYGVTQAGGLNRLCDYRIGCGAAFKLSKTSTGVWAKTVLHQFTDESDGGQPQDGLAIDGAGHLYGTTLFGGHGSGTVFELSPTASGEWRETVIYAFQGQGDGGSPYAKVTLDASGNLYGTTSSFGAYGYGTVFELSPASGGGWTYTVLYSFTGAGDGGSPLGGLILDSAGNLYGTTAEGGGNSGSPGVVYKLAPTSSGAWIETVLHSFNQSDGSAPNGSLVLDASGNLYGTTQRGGDLSGCGNLGCGVVYQLSPNSSGGWTDTVLFTFPPGATGNGGIAGAHPSFGLTLNGDDLYATAFEGGQWSYGVVYRLVPNGSGGWNETVLHAFTGGAHGVGPNAPVIFDASGNLFGTSGGGKQSCGGCGVVFEITP